MKYSSAFTVASHDLDSRGNIRISALMRFMQEAAYLNMKNGSPTAEELRSDGRVFLLSRMTVSIYGKFSHRDELTVYTWPSAESGVSYERCFSVYRDGMLMAEAESVWILFDFKNRKIMRTGEVELNYGGDDGIGLDLPRRLKYPEEAELLLEGCHTASYADTDKNGHINNTVYADILCGFVPEIKSGDGSPVSFYINYSNECLLDDEIKIYRAGDIGEWYFRTVRGDGKTNIEAKILTE